MQSIFLLEIHQFPFQAGEARLQLRVFDNNAVSQTYTSATAKVKGGGTYVQFGLLRLYRLDPLHISLVYNFTYD